MTDGSPVPGWISYNPATGTIRVTPGAGISGTWEITVKATNQHGLSAEISFSVVILTTGIEILGNPVELTLYSNPAKGKVQIDITGKVLTKVGIRISSMVGATVYSGNYPAGEQIVIDLSALPGGIYMVRIDTGGIPAVKKLILEK
jgi:hypothetical protein